MWTSKWEGPLFIIEDEAQHVISNTLDCGEVYGESNTAIVKVMLMVKYDGHRIFKATLLKLLPTHFCPRIGLRKLKIQSTSIASTPTFVYPPHPLPCWWDWDIMWSFLFVSLNSTMISSTIQTAKKRIIGRPPKNNNPTLDFQGVDSDTWWTWWVQMTRRNFGTKWKWCKQPIDLQKTTRNYIWKIEIKNCHNDVWIHDVIFFLAPWHLTSHYDQTNCK